MQLITLLSAVLLTFFSTTVMCYISMATGIGPWIETTLVLIGMLIFSAAHRWYTSTTKSHALGLVAASGGIGGILATACGFSFPTLYFLDPLGFAQLLASPAHFATTISMIALAAGSAGLITAHFFEDSLITQQGLPYPIGELVYKMIMTADNLAKALMLALGFIGTLIFLGIQTACAALSGPLALIERKTIGLFTIPRIDLPLDQLPMFWAIGFVTGHVIAVPLLLGMLSKIFVIDPLYALYPGLTEMFYQHGFSQLSGLEYVPSVIDSTDFTIAFCSGLVLYGAVKGFLELPHLLSSTYQKFFGPKKAENKQTVDRGALQSLSRSFWYALGLIILINGAILSWLSFSFTAQIYLIVFTLICTYQLMLLAGKFGLAPLGRFATFVLVPGMLIFGYTALQITCVALYVEVAGGVACDALFGRKMAQLASIDKRSIVGYQWLGLLVSVAAIGLIMWVFVSHFGLGSDAGALAATRAAGRALLVSIKSFDLGALLFGLLFGHIISFSKISAPLLLGGILMQVPYTLMLVLGGLSTYLVDQKEEYYPFWSGVFASNSLWMLLRAFI